MGKLNYDQIQKGFEKAVTKMQEDLQFLADTDRVSDAFISKQNAIIKALIDYQQLTESIVSGYELELGELHYKNDREKNRLKDLSICLQAICLIHGINDMAVWLSKGMKYLVQEAITLQETKEIQLPYQFLQMMEKTFTEEERRILVQILYRRQRETEFAKLHQLFNELNLNPETLEELKHAKAPADQKD